MDKILQALYDGEIYPAAQYRPRSEQYIAKQKERNRNYEDFMKKIGSPLDVEFIQIMDERLDTIPIELSEMFLDGFRLGARMMIEVFEDKYRKEE